jgi:hypothetical protein
MELLKLVPKWLLLVMAGYVVVLLSYAAYDNRTINLWPPRIEARQEAVAAAAAGGGECSGYKRMSGVLYDDPLRSSAAEWNLAERTYVLHGSKSVAPRKGTLLASCARETLFMRNDDALDDSNCLCNAAIMPAGDVMGQCFCSARGTSRSPRLVRFEARATK